MVIVREGEEVVGRVRRREGGRFDGGGRVGCGEKGKKTNRPSS